MDLSKPSKSTIDSIMQYNIFVQTKATKYGKYAETKKINILDDMSI